MAKHSKPLAPKAGTRGPLGYSPQEAGAKIGLGRNASYEAVRSGDIPAIKVGGIWVVPRGLFHERFGGTPEAA